MKKQLDAAAISRQERLALQVVSQRSSSPAPSTYGKVIAVGNVKGGVGKTTLAVNLAICEARQGSDVLLIDGDGQGAPRAFTQLRAEMLGAPRYTAVSLRSAEIRTQVRQLRGKYQRSVVDAGGRDTSSLRAALTVAALLVVPVLPATFDVWSLEPLQELIQEAREIKIELRTVVLLNAADPSGKDNDDAAAIIREKKGFDYFPHRVIRRKTSRNSAAAGLSVLEQRRADEKAVHEFGCFATRLFGYSGDVSSISQAITKRPGRKTKMNDKRAEKFIMAASADGAEDEGRFVQTPIRFPPSFLARIDRAAKKRGLNWSSWIRYAATKELDIEDL